MGEDIPQSHYTPRVKLINGATGQPWKGMMPPKGRHWRCSPSKLEELDKQGLIEWSKTGVPRKKIYADENDGRKYRIF